MASNPYEKRYAGREYYWGKKPSVLCDRVIALLRPDLKNGLKLLDLGCGEGRNAVYLAKHGFEVTGLDASRTGLEKMEKYAEKEGVRVKSVEADINKCDLAETFDVIFSTGTLHYVSPALRHGKFENYKDHTAIGGLHAFSVIVEKPFVAKAPDADENVTLFSSGELMAHYWGWEILHCEEDIFRCMSSGVPHRHAVNRIVARKTPAVSQTEC